MKSRDFLQQISLLKKPVLTTNDLVKITGYSKSYLKVYLFRLKQKGLILEVERGKYIIPQPAFITASNMVFPSYVSFLSAYSYYQLTTQMPIIIYVVAFNSKKSIKLGEYKIVFVKFPTSKIFGYHKEKFMGKEIFIAEKEKAIIDSLYLPEYCPLDETYIALEADLNLNKLISYALKMNSIVLLKRLGYLLDSRGIDIHNMVRKKLNTRYDLLNPVLGRKGYKKSLKWRLIINGEVKHAE
ncbi:MAG: hypothetical protein AABX04_02445 [Nanoarchaeota archaeon]